jgi:hypothetical protein
MFTCLALFAAACGDDEEPQATTAGPPETTTTARPAEVTPERREFERYIREALLAEGEGAAVEIDCVIDELRVTLPNRAIDEAAAAIEASEEIPQAAVDAAFEAGERCRRAGDQ